MKGKQGTIEEYSDKAVVLRELIDKLRDFDHPSFTERVVLNHLAFLVIKTPDSSFIEVTWVGRLMARINVGNLILRCPSVRIKGKVAEYYLDPTISTPLPVVIDIISEYVTGGK
ncbi:hypothetical protein OBP_020 [Pseudomonas phage OBP]|uniref:hypothetical protein n=1 Tax=Pseudomonas phage OBP TaxID=1124849 RepID=UPI000240D611|nr:hypothetical protein OBP_020 [Pseudomonas phage OBP]AEV89457.1 hypothetical protein OBP_020 [Pseudomonas phage OBP]